MADCGDYQYQAIEYRGLFDLKNAQIVRAQINAIDPAANAASVTLLDECSLDDWLNTAAVPFFYHCENSTGTVEDLANGYKAFASGDMVYILLNQEDGENAAQAYVIGHVDQRGTNVCIQEYIWITKSMNLAGSGYTVDAMYDVGTGALVDIDTFPERDGSPPKPERAIGINDTVLTSWLSHNFASIYGTPIPVIGATIRDYLYGDSCTEPSWALSTSTYPPTSSASVQVPYTGGGFFVLSQGDACEEIDIGNGTYNYKWTNISGPCAYADGGTYAVLEEAEILRNSAQKSHFGNGDTWCAVYFEHYYTKHKGYEGVKMPAYGFTIQDDIGGVEKVLSFYVRHEWDEEKTASISGYTFSADYSITKTQKLIYSGSNFGLWDTELQCGGSFSSSFDVVGSHSPPYDLDMGSFPADTQTGRIEQTQYIRFFDLDEYHDVWRTYGDSRVSGQSFCMLFMGALIGTYQHGDGPDHALCEITLGITNTAFTTGYSVNQGNYEISVLPYSIVYRYTIDDLPMQPLSAHHCIENADIALSTGLNAVVVEMYQLLNDVGVAGNIARWESVFSTDTEYQENDAPPTFSVYKRRTD